MDRVRIKKGGGAFFPPPDTSRPETWSSGSTLLDLVNGGGWACGRVINVVGHESTGKTQLAIEAIAGYRRKFPDAPVRLCDAENAFDVGYAKVLGFPSDVKPWQDCVTVEAFTRDVYRFAKDLPDGGHALYVLDSLDSFSDEAEMALAEDKQSYGTGKPKEMSKFFAKRIALLKQKGVTLMVISQLRDNIGVRFGRKYKRSGGKALAFYSSQVVWLLHLKRIVRTVRGVKRPIGILVQADNEKNKVGTPFMHCTYPIMFHFGVDDVMSMLMWLLEIKECSVVGGQAAAKKLLAKCPTMEHDKWHALRKKLRKAVRKLWRALDVDFRPNRRKYT